MYFRYKYQIKMIKKHKLKYFVFCDGCCILCLAKKEFVVSLIITFTHFLVIKKKSINLKLE